MGREGNDFFWRGDARRRLRGQIEFELVDQKFLFGGEFGVTRQDQGAACLLYTSRTGRAMIAAAYAGGSSLGSSFLDISGARRSNGCLLYTSEEVLLNWIDMGYDPKNYSQAQLNELDSLTARWVADHLRNTNASKTRKRTRHS